MKFQLFALVLVVAGAYAMPSANDVAVVEAPDQSAERLVVANQIRRVIQQISNEIRNAGLDPLEIEKEEFVFVPIPFFVQVRAFIENLRFVGASNIRIHSLSYSVLLNRLLFDISLPQLTLTVGNSGIEGSIFNNKIGGQFKGSLIIESIRLSGDVRLRIGVISGISLRSISLNFRVGGIRSDLSLRAQEIDYSETLNILLNESIPKALEENRVEINKRLENLVRDIFDRL